MLLTAFFGGIYQFTAHLDKPLHVAGVHECQGNRAIPLEVLRPLRASYGVQPEIAVLILEPCRVSVYRPVGPLGRHDSGEHFLYELLCAFAQFHHLIAASCLLLCCIRGLITWLILIYTGTGPHLRITIGQRHHPVCCLLYNLRLPSGYAGNTW